MCIRDSGKGCQTDGYMLEGGEGWYPTLFIRLVQDYGLDIEVRKEAPIVHDQLSDINVTTNLQVAQHLATTYGDKAPEVAKLAQFTGKRWPVVGRRLVDEFPYLEADVKYAVKEYACTVVDVLARRTRLAFLHVHAAEEAISKIVSILGKELGWSKSRMKVLYRFLDAYCLMK